MSPPTVMTSLTLVTSANLWTHSHALHRCTPDVRHHISRTLRPYYPRVKEWRRDGQPVMARLHAARSAQGPSQDCPRRRDAHSMTEY